MKIPAEAIEALMDAASDDGLILRRDQAHDWLEASAQYLREATPEWAAMRSLSATGMHSLEDVAEEFGVDLDALRD